MNSERGLTFDLVNHGKPLNLRRYIMIKKFLMIICAALLMTGCGGEKTSSSDEKTFTYGTPAYGVAMENAGTNPHESYSGWSTLRYGIGETLFKFNEHMELEP